MRVGHPPPPQTRRPYFGTFYIIPLSVKLLKMLVDLIIVQVHSSCCRLIAQFVHTVWLIRIAHFSVGILLLHHYKSDFAHLSDFDIPMTKLSKSER